MDPIPIISLAISISSQAYKIFKRLSKNGTPTDSSATIDWEKAIRDIELPDDVVSAARKAAEDAVNKALDRGDTPEETAEEAGACADEASLVAAVTGGSLEDSELAAITAAEAAVRGGDEGAAEDEALDRGAPPKVVDIVGVSAREGAAAAQKVQEGAAPPNVVDADQQDGDAADQQDDVAPFQ